MGAESTADIIVACAQAAEARGMESLWITDHIAIPPDDAEGSGGRYLDTLTTLAWLGGATRKIKLGSGVLILPYRPMLPTLKQIATLQELTKNYLEQLFQIPLSKEWKASASPISISAAVTKSLL